MLPYSHRLNIPAGPSTVQSSSPSCDESYPDFVNRPKVSTPPPEQKFSPDCYISYQIDNAFRKPPDISGTLHGQRRIRQGGRNHRTALFPSRKAGGIIPLESKLELAHAIELERNPNVISYRTQAIKIIIQKNSYSIPDFLIRKSDNSIEIHEVKPSIEDLSEKQIQKLTITESILNKINIIFKIIDSNSLKKGLALDKLLQQYTRGHLNTWTPMQIKLAFEALQGLENESPEAYEALKKEDLPPQLADYLWFHQYKLWDTYK